MVTHETVNGENKGDAGEARLNKDLFLPLYDRQFYVDGSLGYPIPVGRVEVNGNLAVSGDVLDDFHFILNAWGDLNITLTDLESDAVLILSDLEGNFIAASNNAGTADESITIEADPLTAYILQVGLWSTSDTGYSLEITAPAPWEDRVNGTLIGDAKYPRDFGDNKAGVLSSTIDSSVMGSTGNLWHGGLGDREDVYVITPQFSGEMSARLSGLEADLRLVVYDADFNVLDYSVANGISTEFVSTDVVAGETYYFLMDGAFSPYSLDVNVPNYAPMPPDVVPNLSSGATIVNNDVGDNLGSATSIELSEYSSPAISITGSIGYQYNDTEYDGADFFQFTPDNSGLFTAGVLTQQEGLQVIWRDENGVVLDEFDATDNGYESLLYRQKVVKGQTYYLEIDGVSSSTKGEYMMLLGFYHAWDRVNGTIHWDAGESFADAVDIEAQVNGPAITLEGSVGFDGEHSGFDSLDYYKITPAQSGMATIAISDLEHSLTLSVLNAYGEILYSARHNAGSSESVELNLGQDLQYFIKTASESGTTYRLDVTVPMSEQNNAPDNSGNPPAPAALEQLLAHLNAQWQSLSAIDFDLNIVELLSQLTEGILPAGVGDNVYTPDQLTAGNVLWDVAGVDQLSLSGSSAGWHIELPDSMSGALAVGLAIPDAELQTATHDNLLWLLGEWEQAQGSSGNDKIMGNDLNNYLIGAAGNDQLDGGDGIDTAAFNGGRGGFQINVSDQGISVSGLEGLDQLVDIERLAFTDKHLALDIGGHAGDVAKIIGAVFGAQAVANKHYVGIGLDYRDRGTSYEDLMVFAINERLGVNASAVEIVNLLYQNVVGVAPSASEQQVYTQILTSGEMTVGELGVFAADTDINQNNVDLVGLQTTGLAFDLV